MSIPSSSAPRDRANIDGVVYVYQRDGPNSTQSMFKGKIT